MSSLRRSSPSLASLSRDPVLIAGGLATIAVLVGYLAPGISAEARTWMAWYVWDPGFLLLTLAGLLLGLKALPRQRERRFWRWVAVAYGFWLLNVFQGIALPELEQDQFFAVVTDFFFMGYYLALIFAAELRLDHQRRPHAGIDRFNLWGAVLFTVALVIYFVVIPSSLAAETYDSWLPSLLLYLALDLLIAARFAVLLVACEQRCCRVLYGLLTATFTLSMTMTLLEYLAMRPDSIIPLVAGTPWDLLWALPFFPLLLATRLRRYTGREVAPEVEPMLEPVPARSVGPLVFYTLAFPVIHLLLHYSALPWLGNSQTDHAREVVVILYTVLLGALALVQHRLREQRIAESEERYRRLVEGLPDALLVEQEGRIVFTNPSGERLLAKLGGRLGESSLADLGLAQPADGRSASLPVELLLQPAGGEARQVEVSFLPVRYEQRPALQTIVRDVSTVRRLRDQAERMERLAALGQFSATVAHEIRNPLGSMLFNCGVLERSRELTVADRDAVADVKSAIHRLSCLVDDILDLSRPASPQRMTASIEEIVEAAVSALGETGATIESRFEHLGEGELPDGRGAVQVLVDVHQIERVFTNLLDNAVRACSQGGRVELVTADVGDAVEVAVIDSGCGIPQDRLSRVFDPFFTTRPDGTGLGLAVVAQILDQHDSSYRLDSSPGQGTRFRFRLPKAGDRQVAERIAELPEPAASRMTEAPEVSAVGAGDRRTA